VEITTKKMQDTEHCPESKKSYKMKQGKTFTGMHFFNELKKFRLTGILDTVAITSSSIVYTIWRGENTRFLIICL
jgi:hypothetical protein